MSRASRYVAITAALGTLLFAASAHAYPASLAFDPPSYNFGAKVPGTGPSPPKAFTLTNTGEVSLTVNYAKLAWGPQEYAEPEMFKITSNDCGTLAPGASCTIEVTFNPNLPGPKWGTLTVTAPYSEHCWSSEGPIICRSTNINAQLQLTGIAQTVSLSPAPLSFLPLEVGRGPSPVKTVTVTNESEYEVKIFNVMLANYHHFDSSQFRLSGGTCTSNLVLPPQGTCTIDVAFSPSTPGGLSADLSLIDNGPGGQQFATLEGEGVASPFQSHPPLTLQVSIFRHPDKLTAKRAAVFWFKGTEAVATFECKLDSRPFVPCEPPARFKHLRVGRHYFAVRPIDSSGRSGRDGARYRWRIKSRR
jgi:HYDIN/CFA65/VesB-like, Ig-like domain